MTTTTANRPRALIVAAGWASILGLVAVAAALLELRYGLRMVAVLAITSVAALALRIRACKSSCFLYPGGKGVRCPSAHELSRVCKPQPPVGALNEHHCRSAHAPKPSPAVYAPWAHGDPLERRC